MGAGAQAARAILAPFAVGLLANIPGKSDAHHALPGRLAVLPVLGLGTWRLGEFAGAAAPRVAALREAIALGYRLFDTAEMYGEGGAETALGRRCAARSRRAR